MSDPPAVSRSPLGGEFDGILEEAKRGVCSACNRIYHSLAPSVAGYLCAQGADEPEDMTSEVFLRVFSCCGTFSGNEAQFRSWVFTIAHSRLVDGRRIRSRAPELIVLEGEGLDIRCPAATAAEEEAVDRLGIDNFLLLLDALTCDQSEVLVLRLLSELSVEEVATILEKPPGAVKALQRRALATLRRTLGSEVIHG